MESPPDEPTRIKRRHVATGKRPPGGPRAGAGRPIDTPNALPMGAVGAIKALRHRVPAGTPQEVAEVADEALAAVVDVMRNTDRMGAQAAQVRLSAAKALRDEVCGPATQRLQLAGDKDEPVSFTITLQGPVQ